MLFLKVAIVLCLVSRPFLCYAEVFSALTHMKALVRFEQYLKLLLQESISNQDYSPKWLTQFEEELHRQTQLIPLNDEERFLGHPVNAFLLIRRFNKYWVELEKFLDVDKAEGNLLVLSAVQFYTWLKSVKRYVLRIDLSITLTRDKVYMNRWVRRVARGLS